MNRAKVQGARGMRQGANYSPLLLLSSAPYLPFLLFVLLLTACAPQVVEIEVTRLVQDGTVPVLVELVEPTEVEVTRIVAQEVTRIVPQEIEVVVEVTKMPLGSVERPIQLLFSPMVNTAVIQTRAQPLADFLTEQTDRQFVVGLLDSEQGVVDLMCAAPVDVVAFLSAAGYVLAHEQCGAAPLLAGVLPNELSWQAGMIVVRRDSGITELEQLAGKSWAIPDAASIARTRYFEAAFVEAGIELGERVPVPGDNTAMLAVLNGDVDFATGNFVPPLLPFEETVWQFGEDSPEIWRRLGIAPNRSGIGFVIVNGRPENGGYQIRDARAGIFDIEEDVFAETRILTLSEPIPTDTIAVGADFPVGLANELAPLLQLFAASEECVTSICSTDFYSWSALSPITDSEYDPLRFIRQQLNLSAEELLP